MQLLSRPAHFVYPLLINVSQIASSMLLSIVLQTISKNKRQVTKYKYLPGRHEQRIRAASAPVDLNGY